METEEDFDYIKGHEEMINDPSLAELLKARPEQVEAITERDKASFHKKLAEYDKRFRSLAPYIQRTRVYTPSITDKTRLAASYLLFHKVIQTWEAIVLLSKQGFYTEAMELSRSINESMDLANLFIFAEEDNTHLQNWFNGKIVKNEHARKGFEDAFNSGGFLPDAVPLAKIMSSMYRTMSQYTHTGYVVLLEMINTFTKDFDFEKSAGFHRLDQESHVLEKVVNKVHYALIFYYLKLVGEKDIVNELTSLVPETKEAMSPEELKKAYEKYK